MKKILIQLLIGCLILSCSKDDVETNMGIIGSWGWVRSSGGIAGITYTPESTGENRKLVITRDSLKYYRNDILSSKLKYTVESVEISDEFRNIIVPKSEGIKQFFEVTRNELILTDNCIDCFVNEYARE